MLNASRIILEGAGSIPAEAVGFFGRKNPQHAFLGGEVKPSLPCRRFARHVKEPWVYVEVEITGKTDRPFLARNSVFR